MLISAEIFFEKYLKRTRAKQLTIYNYLLLTVSN